MEAQEQLAARHIALRERAGLTQEQEAKIAGVSPTTISGIESGKIVRPHLKTLLKLARALGADVGELRESGKVETPSSQAKLFNNGILEEDRRLRYLLAWRAFVHNLARRWEQQPPKTEAEITPLFEAMTAVVNQGVFEPSEASVPEAKQLTLLTFGFQRLNEIADKVEKDEEAEQRRATFRVIQEQQEQHSA